MDFNIFEGMKVRGVPEIVISRGKVAVEGGEVCFFFFLRHLMYTILTFPNKVL